jgi:uncharacterized membrane protein
MAGTIDHPVGWTFRVLRAAMTRPYPERLDSAPIVVNHITREDLLQSLRQGFADFTASRTDVVLLCIMYPMAGLVFSRLAVQMSLMPLIFPLIAGFALLGPVLAAGTYQMSRIRERAGRANWLDAFSAFRSPGIGSIVSLGCWLLLIFALWMLSAHEIYRFTFGHYAPATASGFLHEIVSTGRGWALMILGVGVGGLFAALVLSISIVSFPLLLDRNTGVEAAVRTSIRATRMNPAAVATWGAIVAALLALGSVFLLIGLAVVVPVLGHATWHLYRKLVAPARTR